MCGEVYKGDDAEGLSPIDTTEGIRRRIREILNEIEETSESVEEGRMRLADIEKEIEESKDDPDWQKELASHALEVQEVIDRTKRAREEFDRQMLQLSSLLEGLRSNN